MGTQKHSIFPRCFSLSALFVSWWQRTDVIIQSLVGIEKGDSTSEEEDLSLPSDLEPNRIDERDNVSPSSFASHFSKVRVVRNAHISRIT